MINKLTLNRKCKSALNILFRASARLVLIVSVLHLGSSRRMHLRIERVHVTTWRYSIYKCFHFIPIPFSNGIFQYIRDIIKTKCRSCRRHYFLDESTVNNECDYEGIKMNRILFLLFLENSLTVFYVSRTSTIELNMTKIRRRSSILLFDIGIVAI